MMMSSIPPTLGKELAIDICLIHGAWREFIWAGEKYYDYIYDEILRISCFCWSANNFQHLTGARNVSTDFKDGNLC